MVSKKIDALACPFCGRNSATLVEKSHGYSEREYIKYKHSKFYVHCTICDARGGIASGNIFVSYWCGNCHEIDELPDWVTTKDVLKERAIRLWNMRVDSCQNITRTQIKLGDIDNY